MKQSIYTFTCPITNEVLYVGRSQNFKRRVKSHLNGIRNNRYRRHPFYCKLQSLYKQYTYEQLSNQFTVIDNCETVQQAIDLEYHYIHNVYGINNLLNIAENTSFGGDVYHNHPHYSDIIKKLKGRIPWNAGTKGIMKPNSGSFQPGTILIKYILTSPNNEIFELNGQIELKNFCDEWNTSHKAIWVKDPNWISVSAFKLGKSKKGWKVEKVKLV